MEYLLNPENYLGLLPVPVDFAVRSAPLGWRDIMWAYSMNILGWRSLVEFARNKVSASADDTALLELAYLPKDRAGEAGDMARAIAKCELPVDKKTVKSKWLYILLKLLYERRANFSDPFGIVEQIYADFEYPEEIQRFVRWFPADPPLPPEASESEYVTRMERSWEEYLKETAMKNWHQ